MRADGWNRIPLIRMTNVNLLPKDGHDASTTSSRTPTTASCSRRTGRWSIDDRRLNFQFGTEVCREIKGGKLGQLYRTRRTRASRYELWRSMDAVGDASSWKMWGTPNCGKGEPGQTGHVGHGVSGRAVPQRAGRGGGMSATPRASAAIAEEALRARASGSSRRRPRPGADEAEALVGRPATAR